MSYSLVKINTFYSDYVQDYYRRFPSTVNRRYNEQYDNLVADRFAWANYFERHLTALGVETHEIYENVTHLQRAWAREHDLSAVGEDLLLAQLRFHKPSVIFSEYVNFLAPEKLRALRELVPSVKLLCAHFCAPVTNAITEGLKAYDVIFTCTPGFVAQFRSLGMTTHLLNHAFEPANLPDLTRGNRMSEMDLVFAGSLVSGREFHDSRLDFIERLLTMGAKMRVYSSLQKRQPLRDIAKRSLIGLSTAMGRCGLRAFPLKSWIGEREESWKRDVQSYPFSRRLVRAARPPLYGISMLKALAKAKIVFNSHVGSAGRYAGNMRLFEATGSGACLVTDAKENLKELFEPDYEVVTYRSPEECSEKIGWLLANPGERAAIAAAGQKRCLRDHTFSGRAHDFHEIVSRALS